MSYVEYLLCVVLMASAIVGTVMYIIGKVVMYLIDHKGDIC